MFKIPLYMLLKCQKQPLRLFAAVVGAILRLTVDFMSSFKQEMFPL